MNAITPAPAGQRKPERGIRLEVRPEGYCSGIVRITVGEEHTDYFLYPLVTDFGRGFRLEKVDPIADRTAYAVNIDGDRRTCDCQGFARWSHCKHADGLAALIAAGRL
jgi:hypothetical protein